MSRHIKDFTWEFSDEVMEGRFHPERYDIPGAVNTGIEKGLEKVAERATKRMRRELTSFGLNPDDIMSDLVVELLDGGISLRFTGDELGEERIHRYMFVEFGTGIVGAGGPEHPFLRGSHQVDWEYDDKGHGESGWWYPTTYDDPNTTKEFRPAGKNKKGESYRAGWWAWTKGQESRPFLYNTWLYISRSATETVQGAINKELKLLEESQE